jgi:amino acid adenylation domain-containing protein
MNWNEWHKYYDNLPNLQERLRIVREQIAAALDEFQPGLIQIVSICAGDGRDLLGILQNHPRRSDVAALLLDNNAESIALGKKSAEETGLAWQIRFLEADATLAKNYLGAVPADLVLLSGFLGHLRHADVPGLIGSLPMFCKAGGQAIWNRHLVLHDGHRQVPLIRDFFRKTDFEEIHFEKTDANGFAVGRARFTGRPKSLDSSRVLFEFVGLDKLLSAEELSNAKTTFNGEAKNHSSAKVGILPEAETSIPARFREMAALHPSRMALGGEAWRPTYAELDVATNRLANVLVSRGGKAGDRVALLMRHDSPLIAAALAVLKAGRIVVVLNPSEPPARLKQILDDAEPGLIVTDLPNENLAGQIAQKNQAVLCFENQNSGPAHNPEVKIAPADIAWLIYTSGSTGRPKGVIQTHRNIAHNVLRLSRGMSLSAEDRIVLLGSPSGGQGVATTWCALLNGAVLFPFPIAEKGAAGFKKWMLENKITVYVSSTSVFRSLAKTLDAADSFSDTRLVRFGSEAATVDDFAAFQKHFSDKCVLLNSLSSSETGNVTQHRFARNDTFAGSRLPVGLPVDGIEIFLSDENGREVRDGETGEIIVRSHYLSPGYWRNELLTAERFSENGDGVRAFRSGDLGRRLDDGSLVFMDRKDARVKIHGYRVEISEIEDALTQQSEVEAAIVSAGTAADGEARLVAHVVPRNGKAHSAETLRRELRRTLPAYMVPAAFVFLDKFPLTPHGKIDHEKLQQMAPSLSVLLPMEKPATGTEILLADIWKKVFGQDSIGLQDNFFDLGGDSLSASVVAAQVYAALKVELDLRIFADHSTLAALSLAIDRLHSAGHTKNSPEFVRAPRDVPLPLSFAQERTWKQSQTAEGSLGLTVACCHRIGGLLNVGVLRESMNHLVRRHEILRTTFDEIAGRLVQIVHPAEPVSLSLLDLAGTPEAEPKATRLFREQSRRAFDLKRGPLLRFMLVRIRENEHWLLRVNHHIISDAWSWKVFFRELALVYEARLDGETSPLPAFEPLQYGDYAVRQRNALHREGQTYKETIDWWSVLLSGEFRPVKLPFHRMWRSRHAAPADGFIRWGLNPETSRRLERMGREKGATYYMIRLAAFAALLSNKAAQSDVILGTYMTERNCVESQNMFGNFVNLVTLRFRCDHTRTFNEWLSVVRKTVSETQSHSEIRYEQLCEELRKRNVNPPEIGIIFSVAEHSAPVRFGGLEMTWLDQHIERMPWGFCVVFDQHNEGQHCQATFDARIYNPARVKDWVGRFARLLDAAAHNPDLSIGKLLAMSKKRQRSCPNTTASCSQNNSN